MACRIGDRVWWPSLSIDQVPGRWPPAPTDVWCSVSSQILASEMQWMLWVIVLKYLIVAYACHFRCIRMRVGPQSRFKLWNINMDIWRRRRPPWTCLRALCSGASVPLIFYVVTDLCNPSAEAPMRVLALAQLLVCFNVVTGGCEYVCKQWDVSETCVIC